MENDEPSTEHSKLLISGASTPAIEADNTNVTEFDDVMPSFAKAFADPSTAETTFVSGSSPDGGIWVVSLVTILWLAPTGGLVVMFCGTEGGSCCGGCCGGVVMFCGTEGGSCCGGCCGGGVVIVHRNTVGVSAAFSTLSTALTSKV